MNSITLDYFASCRNSNMLKNAWKYKAEVVYGCLSNFNRVVRLQTRKHRVAI
uniref:Uncharacterized protein n=1 Tax=Arundo donax TaxID=35708 RepID=A0A0A9BUQ6_ARUDO